MKESLKLITFVLILGAISALVLIGVDYITKDRIRANQLFEFQNTVLHDNEDTDFSGEMADYFNDIMEVEEKDELVIYTHKNTKNVSFTFDGKGLWDDIKGIITLKEDFKTIVNVTITEQGETPGLGALVAERDFLDTLIGKVFDPTLTIKKDATGDSEVDSISGATGTSSQFQVILNNVYKKYYEAFIGELVLVDEDELFEAILIAHNISFDEDSNLSNLMDENFKVFEDNDLRIFVNNKTGRLSFAETYEMIFALDGVVSEDIMIVITLETDFETLYKLQTLDDENSSHWGKTNLLKQEELDKAIGLKFPGIEFVKGTSDDDNKVDGITDATYTRNSFNPAINEMYETYYEAFKDTDFDVEEDLTVLEEILDYFEIDYTSENIKDVFSSSFETENENNNELFVKEDTNEKIIVFEEEYTLAVQLDVKETLTTILILEEDFITINKIIVLHDNDKAHWGKTRFFTEEILDEAIGKNISKIKFVDEANKEDEVDSETSATTTRTEFNDALEKVYNNYASVYLSLSDEEEILYTVLTNNNIKVNLDDVKTDKEILTTLINDNFDIENYDSFEVFLNKHTNDITYYFESTYSLGRGLPESEPLTTVVTLRDNLTTIVKISVIHDEDSSQWGKVRLFIDDVLNQATNKNVLKLKFVAPNTEENNDDVDLIADATTTRREFNAALKEYYNDFYLEFNDVDEEDITKTLILLNNEVLPIGDLEALFNETFDTHTEDDLTIYINKHNQNVSFTFIENYSFAKGDNNERPLPEDEDVQTIVTLKNDFKTIISIKALHDGKGSHWGKTRLFTNDILGKAKGKDITNLKFVLEVENSDDVDYVAGPTTTVEEFNQYIEQNYTLIYNTFKEMFK